MPILDLDSVGVVSHVVDQGHCHARRLIVEVFGDCYLGVGDTHLVVSLVDAPTRIYPLDVGELMEVARSRLVRGDTSRLKQGY